MTHGIRIRQDPGWATGSIWTTTEQSALDAALVAAVNGDGGGLWSPTAALTIQGAGLRLIACTHTISGSHSTVATNGTTALLSHGDSDYCTLAAGHAGAFANLRSPIGTAAFTNGWSSTTDGVFGLVGTQLGASCRVPLRVHNGAELGIVQFTFTVAAGATAVPTQTPRFGVFAQDTSGNVWPLSTAKPYQYQTGITSPSQWSNSGLLQALFFAADVYSVNPRVLIDTSQYSYFAEIIEASGAGAVIGQVEYFDPLSEFSNIQDIRPR